jgi:hypothetical protein
VQPRAELQRGRKARTYPEVAHLLERGCHGRAIRAIHDPCRLLWAECDWRKAVDDNGRDQDGNLACGVTEMITRLEQVRNVGSGARRVESNRHGAF